VRVEVGFLKPSSRSMGLVLDRANEVLSNEMLVVDQPTGRLRNFLNTAFESDAAVEDAFLSGGGTVVVRTRHGKGPRATMWVVRDGLPVLAFSGGSKGAKVEVKVLVEGGTWS